MKELSSVSVVLPSLDPDEKLMRVIDGLAQYGFTDIILVNDGSKPENLHYFTDAAGRYPQVHLLCHEHNRGKGAALKTAFAWVLENRPDSAGVITVDGDDQHHPEDTRRCAERMLETGRMVLGVRDFSRKDVPFRSRAGNRITSGVFKVFVGMTVSDTQTGLRAIPKAALPLMLEIAGDRFEYETNMLLSMKEHDMPFDEVKIRTVYIEDNKSSHFRAVRDSFRIYKLIFAHFFRYLLASLLSALADAGLFALLSWLLCERLAGLLLTAVPTVCARGISSLLNFFLNKQLVFQSKESTGKALLRYYALAIPMLLAQLGLTHVLTVLFHVSGSQTALRSALYVLVMTVLFLSSYVIQQRWVFHNPKRKASTIEDKRYE